MQLIEIILQNIKQRLPHLRQILGYRTADSKVEEGVISLQYNRVLTEEDNDDIISIINIFKSEDYKLGSTFFVDYFAIDRINQYDVKITHENQEVFYDILDKLKDGIFYSKRDEVFNFVGKKIMKIEFKESFAELSSSTRVNSQIKNRQSEIDSNPSKLDSCDTKIEGDKQYWFIVNSDNVFITKPNGFNVMYLVVKQGRRKPTVVGYISFSVSNSGTNYKTDTVLILTAHRGKGYSKVMDKYIIEKTDLKYGTDLTFTKDGFLKMRANKKILPWESFINNFLNW